MDTGAATNYISNKTICVFLKRKNSVVTIKEVENQGVQLANGEREETNQIASLKIGNGKYNEVVNAFILNLPNIDLILGLPWYRKSKPVINFSNNIYFIQLENEIIPIVPEENNKDPPSLCTNAMTGPI